MYRIIKATGMLTCLLLLAMICGCTEIPGAGSSSAGATRQEVEKALHKLAESIEPGGEYSGPVIYPMLEEVLHKNERIFGAAWAIPLPQADRADLYYLYRDGGTYVTRTETAVDTTEESMSWYRTPLVVRRGGWSRPYQVDDGFGSKLNLITYSLPIIANGKTTMVIACDYLISKEEIKK